MTNGDRAQAVVKLLMQGPKRTDEICALVGGNKTRGYGIMTKMRKEGIIENDGHGANKLTRKALAQIGSATQAIALPAPELQRTSSGRLARGSGNIVLHDVLNAKSPMPANALYQEMRAKGVGTKAVSGIMRRAKRDGLIKKNGAGYSLTAKGQRIELGA